MEKRRLIHSLFPAAVLLFLLAPTGCSVGYVIQAALGQARILCGSVPIKEGLKDPSLDRLRKERLQLVSRIKEFGEKSLGLRETGNYETVYLKSNQSPIFLISACPADSLKRITWWFPVVGRMPYLGFFDLPSAQEEMDRLKDRGLDVHLARADAYSTLGWFRDPVTLNLIDGSTPDLVETILHEMTHTTLYVKGRGEFNEGLAVLVGKHGARLFLKTCFGPDHPLTLEAKASILDERLFSAFMDALLQRLERLYSSPISSDEKLTRRRVIFAEALADFARIKPRLLTDRFRGFGGTPLNNAYLSIIGLYHRHFAFFEQVLARNNGSIPGMIEHLTVLSREEGDIMNKILTSSPPGP